MTSLQSTDAQNSQLPAHDSYQHYDNRQRKHVAAPQSEAQNATRHIRL